MYSVDGVFSGKELKNLKNVCVLVVVVVGCGGSASAAGSVNMLELTDVLLQAIVLTWNVR